ncbi:hypothetical protein L917_03413, partial [Phytophthora nicotianae]
MPKVSDRQALKDEVVDLFSLVILEEEFDEDLGGRSPFDDWFGCFPVESSVEELYEVLAQVISWRFLGPRVNRARSRGFAREFFRNLDDEEFRSLTRTTRESFEFICDLIETHR